MSEFNKFAKNYDELLNRSLKISGENHEYFSEKRISQLINYAKNKENFSFSSLLDFGCGVGNFYNAVLSHIPDIDYLGVDVSIDSINTAKGKFSSSQFKHLREYEPNNNFSCIYSNGVFHHIKPNQREKFLNYIYNSLNINGFFSFWENNPYNLGTRYIMSKNPFDKDAQLISPSKVRGLLKQVGFNIVSTNYYFYFPRCLNLLRRFEFMLKKIPLGAQYNIIATK
jgi:trans-aconitate methyltransferase